MDTTNYKTQGLWDSLISCCPTDEPLLVGGDFNNVMDFDERIGGRLPIEREIREFMDTSAYLNLQDCPSMGCFFTWTNLTIFSHIDRLMCNNAWFEMGWTIKSHFHTREERYDHSACTPELFNPTKRFRETLNIAISRMKTLNFEKNYRKVEVRTVESLEGSSYSRTNSSDSGVISNL